MHCVNLILIRKAELRNSKISSIIDGGDFPKLDIPYLILPQDIIAFPTLEKADVCKNFGSGVTFIAISTDYFGGPGEQSASLNETIIYGDNFHYKTIKVNRETNAIDKILSEYGVICENGQDEFDSIHLGNYRSNEAYIKEYKKIKLINQILVTTPKF